MVFLFQLNPTEKNKIVHLQNSNSVQGKEFRSHLRKSKISHLKKLSGFFSCACGLIGVPPTDQRKITGTGTSTLYSSVINF